MNINVLEFVNSFMSHFGLAISNKKQIIAKVTVVALAILAIGNSPSVIAERWCPEMATNCMTNCGTNNDCKDACMIACCKVACCYDAMSSRVRKDYC